jgi:hypothetical protein
MTEIRRQIEMLKDMGCYDEAEDILHECKNFDVDWSCSSKTLVDYVGEDMYIGFADETGQFKELGYKLKQFCERVKQNNVKVEYKNAISGRECKLFDCDYACSNSEFVKKWDEVFKKWVVVSGVIVIESIEELEEFAQKLIELY